MARFAWIVIGWLALLPAQAASFDCAKAASSVEKMICANAALSAMDSGLAESYMAALDYSADKQAVIQGQRQWLKEVRDVCTDTTCLDQAYEQRHHQLWEMSEPPLAPVSAGPGIDDAKLQAFLLSYLKEPPGRYETASTSLDGGPEPQVFVRLLGRQWCGSGGCTMLLLKQSNGAFKVVDRFTICFAPVYVLPSKTNGWQDIAITIRDDLQYHPTVLQFDGKAYPRNLHRTPFHPLDKHLPGLVRLPLGE